MPLPSIHALLGRRIPIKGLGNIVGKVAHVAAPSVAVIKEGHEWVDVGSTSSAARDYLVLHNRDRIVQVMKSCIWLNNERKGQLALLEQRVGGGYGIQRGSHILWRAVGIWGRGNARLKTESQQWAHRPTREAKELTLGGRIMGGGGSSSSATLKGWLSRSVG